MEARPYIPFKSKLLRSPIYWCNDFGLAKVYFVAGWDNILHEPTDA